MLKLVVNPAVTLAVITPTDLPPVSKPKLTESLAVEDEPICFLTEPENPYPLKLNVVPPDPTLKIQ